jgi:hypothetical protein
MSHQEWDFMKRLAILFILTTLLLGSCAPASASPTQPVAVTVTQTVIPSRTPQPTSTAIPSATPYPPLHTQGPYLLFTRDHKSLTIMDADGSGRKQIQLPDDGYMKDLAKSVSPDGKWIAYFTGSKDKPYDLALNLFNLKDETSLLISNLIAPDFPNSLEPVTDTAYFTEYDTDCSNDPICRLSIIESAFEYGIESLSWSPNGGSLAFAAQIDGPSSDIYVFDVEENSIRRLTNELANIYQINWSPSGQKVLYETSQPGTIYTSHDLRAANPKIKSAQNPKIIDGGPFWLGIGWITDNLYLFYTSGDGGPNYSNIRYINASDEKVTNIWPFPADSVAFNGQNQTFIISFSPFYGNDQKKNPLTGTYQVSLNGKRVLITDEIYYFLEEQNIFNSNLGMDANGQLISIALDETISLFDRKVDYQFPPKTSPDGKLVLIRDDKGIELYSEDLQIIKSWNIYDAEIIWRPDSTGIFLVTDAEMDYLPIPNGEPISVADCEIDDCPYFDDFVWLP